MNFQNYQMNNKNTNFYDDFENDDGKSNKITETIEEVDPRTGSVRRITRTVIKSTSGPSGKIELNNFGDFGNFGKFPGFDDDDDDLFIKKLGKNERFDNHHFVEEYECGNGSKIKKTSMFVTYNGKINNFGDDDDFFDDNKKKFNQGRNSEFQSMSDNKISKNFYNQNDDNPDNYTKPIRKLKEKVNENVIPEEKEKEIEKNYFSKNNANDFGSMSYGSKKNKKTFDLEEFRKECLNEHNKHRRNHRVCDLKFNNDLQTIAQKYAEKLAATNSFKHSGNSFNGDDLGENLYMQGGLAMVGELPTNSWYDEINDYSFNNPDKSKGDIGHFTQLVWKESEEVGIGCAQSSDGSFYCVANYYPAGNCLGEFKKNVFPKK